MFWICVVLEEQQEHKYAPEAVELQLNFPQFAASGYLDLEYPLIRVVQTEVLGLFFLCSPWADSS